LWFITTIISLSAVVWFVIGTTANFQRSMDLVSTVVLVYFGVPSVIMILISLVLFSKRWLPTTLWEIIGVSVLMICMLALSPTLFTNVNTSGWLSEKVMTDTLQITDDGKYEYNLELINLFQRNSHAKLYMKDRFTNEEFRIPLDLQVKKIRGISIEEKVHWISLEETTEVNKYILFTNSKFPLPNEKYEIDVSKRSSTKVR
jgi:hypothetical protein